MSMKCPACGKENVDGAKFCKKCGAYLAWSATAQASTPDFQPTIMVPDSEDPESDATVIRPVAKPAARQAPAAVPAQPDPLLEALADRPGPSWSPERSEAAVQTEAPNTAKRTGRAGLIIAGLLLIVAVGAAAAYWLLGREPTPARARPAAVVPAEAVAVPTPAPQTAPVPAADAVPAQAQPPLAAPAPDPVPAPVPAAVPAPMPAPEPLVAPPVKPAPVSPAAAAKPRPKPAPKPAPIPAAPRPAAPAPAPVSVAPPAPVAAEPPPVPAGPSSPAQACEGKSFFGKPACMNEQCSTPRFAKHAQCVELREQNRRREEQQQRN